MTAFKGGPTMATFRLRTSQVASTARLRGPAEPAGTAGTVAPTSLTGVVTPTENEGEAT